MPRDSIRETIDWRDASTTLGRVKQLATRQPLIWTILAIGFFFGLYSEGFDRLWVKHLLDTFELPLLFGNNEIAFFSILRAIGTLLTIFAVRYVEKRLDTSQPSAIGRTMLLVTGLIGMLLAADLFNLYMCCELMSLAAYALVGFRRRTAAAVEAGFKYLIMGSVGTIVLLMGISFLYRAPCGVFGEDTQAAAQVALVE